MRKHLKNAPIHIGCRENGAGRRVTSRIARHAPLVTGFLLAGAMLLAGCKKSGNVAPGARPPETNAPTRNFSSAEYYPAPNQTRMKLRLSGAEGRVLPDGRLLIRQLKLEAFNTNGSPQTVIEAPACTYDTLRDTASSAGRLRARNGDGKVILEGDGFLWRQDESFLTISNNVKTLIASIAIVAAGATNILAQTNWDAQLGSGRAPTVITAHRGDFSLTARRAVYSGNVHVNNPQMNLTCARMIADMSPAGGRVDHIVAETNVVIDFLGDEGQRWLAVGDKAVYNYSVQNGVTNEIITLTGNAAVTNSTGTNVNFAFAGEPILLNLLKKTVHVENETSIINPIPRTAGTNAVPAPVPPGAASNSPPEKPPLVSTNRSGNSLPRPISPGMSKP